MGKHGMPAGSPPRPRAPPASTPVPTPPLPLQIPPKVRSWSWVPKPLHQRVEEGEEASKGRLQDASGNECTWAAREVLGATFRARGPLTSRVRISCWVRSLDTAHLVRSPRRLPMEMSMSFWSCPHCCSARLAAAPGPPSAAAASPPPRPSFFSPIAAARSAALSMPRHRGRGVAEAESPGGAGASGGNPRAGRAGPGAPLGAAGSRTLGRPAAEHAAHADRAAAAKRKPRRPDGCGSRSF